MDPVRKAGLPQFNQAPMLELDNEVFTRQPHRLVFGFTFKIVAPYAAEK